MPASGEDALGTAQHDRTIPRPRAPDAGFDPPPAGVGGGMAMASGGPRRAMRSPAGRRGLRAPRERPNHPAVGVAIHANSEGSLGHLFGNQTIRGHKSASSVIQSLFCLKVRCQAIRVYLGRCHICEYAVSSCIRGGPTRRELRARRHRRAGLSSGCSRSRRRQPGGAGIWV